MRPFVSLSLFVVMVLVAGAVHAADAVTLVEKYHECRQSGSCETLERELVMQALSETDILDVQDTMPSFDEIDYVLQPVDLCGDGRDYALTMSVGRIGYVVTYIWDSDLDGYYSLRVIKAGRLGRTRSGDLTGDGAQELVVYGYGLGSDYSSEWIAIYKLRDREAQRILTHDMHVQQTYGELRIEEEYDIMLVSADGKAAKDIVISGKILRKDAEAGAILSEKKVSEKYSWDEKEFLYKSRMTAESVTTP